MSHYLYTDASIRAKNKNTSSYAYLGGMITDEQGKILFSFYDKIYSKTGFKCSHIDYAEATALEVGLTHAESMGIKNIKCFTDSMHCVEAIQNFQFNTKGNIDKINKNLLKRMPHQYKSLHIEKILDILAVAEEFFENFEVKHIPRAHNQYADHMSNYLRIFQEGKKSDVNQFKKMLKTNLLSGCSYDFTEERKAHITEDLKIKAALKIAKKTKSSSLA
jgi:ribonuclease HI